MKWIGETKAMVMLVVNFVVFYINRPDYQQALFGVYSKFAWSFYNDAVWLT
jgi:hypothetical protein